MQVTPISQTRSVWCQRCTTNCIVSGILKSVSQPRRAKRIGGGANLPTDSPLGGEACCPLVGGPTPTIARAPTPPEGGKLCVPTKHNNFGGEFAIPPQKAAKDNMSPIGEAKPKRPMAYHECCEAGWCCQGCGAQQGAPPPWPLGWVCHWPPAQCSLLGVPVSPLLCPCALSRHYALTLVRSNTCSLIPTLVSTH